MDITMLPPSTILSNHSHISLLASPLPNTNLRPGSVARRRYSPTLNAAYGLGAGRYRRSPEPPAPKDGSSPLSSMPDEIILSVLSWLDWDDLLSLQSVCKRWKGISTSSALHHTLTFLSLPPSPLPTTVETVLMRHVRNLHLHLFPYPTRGIGHPTSTLIAMLNAIPPNQLKSLSLPFSAPYLPGAELGLILRRIGTMIEHLDLRGSGLVGNRWIGWLVDIGKDGAGLRALDLGFTSISSLPLTPSTSKEGVSSPLIPSISSPVLDIRSVPQLDVFRNLQTLSLASCTYLPESVLTDFLGNLPVTMEKLDISRLDVITFTALWEMRVIHDISSGTDTAEDWQPTALKEIKVVGIDHLTRLDVRRLKRHWEEQRRPVVASSPWGSGQSNMDVDVDRPHDPISVQPLRWRSPHTPPNTYRHVSLPITPESPNMDLDGTSHISKGVLTPSPPMPTHPFFNNNTLPTPPPSTSPPPSSSYADDTKPGSGARDKININIIHSAILESEDEAGYRQFIGEVVSGTLGGSTGLGLGWGDHAPHNRGLTRSQGWVEVDGGVM